jgi:GMP synthase (glutamine-hydrolysing)
MKRGNATRHAVAIRHVAFEDLGNLADVLQEHGFEITYLDAGLDDLAEVDALAPDLMVVLGAPIGAYEENVYPFLVDEMRLLEERLEADAPTIGICLGAQLMARVLGARVYAGTQPEIGWGRLTLSEAGLHSPLVYLSGESTSVLHWHNDTFDCPDGAVHLASTSITANQAFSWRGRCLALQFHPEVALRGFERWLVGHACEINKTAGCSVTQLRRETKQYASLLALQARKCWESWLGQAGMNARPTDVPRVRPSRQLIADVTPSHRETGNFE